MSRRRLMGEKRLVYFEQRFTVSTRWVVPDGCKEVDVFLVGAGGGAGGFTNNWGSHGGGGGGYTKTYKGSGYVKPASGTWEGSYYEGRDGNAIPVSPGQYIQIIVGVGVENGNGGYSQFMNENYRAEGGKIAGTYTKGGDGGSAGGSWFDDPNGHGSYPDGMSDGADSRYKAKGQGHTTRDWGTASGKRNAGGGASSSSKKTPSGGISDYSAGSGEYQYMIKNNGWMSANSGGGGYGGGASAIENDLRMIPSAGGNGTVLVRGYKYE